MLYGLTPLGVVHTAISLVAVAAGLMALARDKQITPANRLGQVYIVTTVITALTGFGIFQHGGFGKPHALGVLTLLVLALAAVARRSQLFGAKSRLVEVLSYSATFLFHMIPAITETSTRLPLGAPLLPNAEAPALQVATGVLGLLFVIGAVLQARWLRGARARRRLPEALPLPLEPVHHVAHHRDAARDHGARGHHHAGTHQQRCTAVVGATAEGTDLLHLQHHLAAFELALIVIDAGGARYNHTGLQHGRDAQGDQMVLQREARCVKCGVWHRVPEAAGALPAFAPLRHEM